MILPDVNVIVYAYKREEELHADYADWLNDAASGSEALALVDVVLTGFLRIVTNHRIYADPASLSEALSFVTALRAIGPARVVHATTATWQQFAAFVGTDRLLRGNLVPDTWLAAIAVTNGAKIATADAGFARFAGLEWFDPAG
ncbi:TA system VapC family ribonuclease toxin [Candidatus Poriferisodalis multihospitum]|uniref:TA system VapC family ribonuclease toxin n=1 Tax=Candidatus Poriferisodalis multihospitum TaxID=2983191 RepID=UPI002B25F69D|nr:TA system VapC family ribonuclease toxin [Candidatus Poriferisodalis multihospitum]